MRPLLLFIICTVTACCSHQLGICTPIHCLWDRGNVLDTFPWSKHLRWPWILQFILDFLARVHQRLLDRISARQFSSVLPRKTLTQSWTSVLFKKKIDWISISGSTWRFVFTFFLIFSWLYLIWKILNFGIWWKSYICFYFDCCTFGRGPIRKVCYIWKLYVKFHASEDWSNILTRPNTISQYSYIAWAKSDKK